MRASQLYQHLNERIEPPVGRNRVVEQIGDDRIDAPTGRTEKISELLPDNYGEKYSSVNDLFMSIFPNLSDSHIGRKYYDDRGPNLEDL